MTLGAYGRGIGLSHRAPFFKRSVTGAAAKLIRWHAASLGPPDRWLNTGVNSTPMPLRPSPATTRPVLEYVPETDEPIVAHIVKTKPSEDAAAKVLEARIYGTPLEALCGHVWIPSRDPKQVPMCQACKEIYETYRMFNENLNETPNE